MAERRRNPISFILRLPALALAGLVRFYQLAIGPWLPSTCRYTPSCSQYSIIALREYGAVKGTILTCWRLLRCAPWGGHGHDPPRWFGEEAPVRADEEHADSRGGDSNPAHTATSYHERNAER